MTTSIRTSADGLSSIIAVNGVDRFSIDQNGKATAVKFAGLVEGGIHSGTASATTSGTAHDFTGIPAWVKRITINFDAVSTNGTSNLLVQLGDSGGVEVVGYKAGSIYSTTTLGSTSGFPVSAFRDSASETYSGSIVISALDPSAFKWAMCGNLSTEVARVHASAGAKVLSATLDRIRLTTVNGTDVFDAGQINILYE